jgi:gliding motility-associated-like protein
MNFTSGNVKKWVVVCFVWLVAGTAISQITVAMQGGEPGDTWNYSSTLASALSQSEAQQAPNKTSGTTSLVVGGNTGGGNCFASGSGNGPSTARTFTFNTVDISQSNDYTRTLTFNWGNRFPMCSGTGWDSGENLVFTAYHDGIAQTPVTLATGSNNAQFSILTHNYTWNIPPCVNNFYFVVSVTTNRADELLFVDDVLLTTPQLNVPTAQPSPISGVVSVCGGIENYSVTGVANVIYTWSGLPAGAQFVSANGTTSSNSMDVNWGSAAAGTYQLTVTPSNACGVAGPPQTISVTIIGAPTPLTISGPTTFCAGDVVTLTSNYASGNVWSTGETTQSIQVAAFGTYSLDVQTTCTTLNASQTLTATSATVASITASGPTAFCNGSSVTLTSGSANNNTWSTGETTQSIVVSAAGTYSLSVVGTCNTANASEQITIIQAPVAGIIANGPLEICQSDSVQLVASGGDTYSWSNGDAGTSIYVHAPGSYTVTAVNQCGSDTSTAIIVTALPEPTAQITGNSSFCEGSSLVLTASGGNSYLWSTGATGNSLTVSNAGTYTVDATNQCGTVTSNPFTVIQNPLPTAQISGNASFCEGSSLVLTASGGNSYLWSTGDTGNSLTVSNAGTYTVDATNQCGTVTSNPFTVTQNPLPTAQILGNTSFCEGSSSVLTASGGNSYLWSTGDTGNSLTVSNAGTYTVDATNQCGTVTSNPFTVTQNPLPTAQITGNTTFCAGDSVLLTANGGLAYLWSNGATTTSIYATVAGNYTVTSFNQCGQVTSAPFSVTIQQLPVAQITGNLSVCSGESSVLTASGGNAYLWSTGAQTASITVLTQGVYSVTVSNSCGTSSISVTLTEIPIQAGFTATPTSGSAPLPVNFTNTSVSDLSTCTWDFGDGNTSNTVNANHVYAEPGNYTVQLTVTNSLGCTDVETLVISVLSEPSLIIIPNVFTPNGDGNNDLFLITSERIESYRLQLFNRWGNLIVESVDPSKGWDGQINGEPASEGTYFYQLEAIGSDLKEYTKTGFFDLLR